MAITFNGASKLITLDTVTSETVSNLYSRWKDWVRVSDNAKFLPAFSEVGGEDLGGGLQSGINIFLRNDLGWRIKPPEMDIVITISGNLYPNSPAIDSFIPTTGGFDTIVRLNLSANLLQKTGTDEESAQALLDLANGVEPNLTLRQALRLIAAATAGKVSGAEGNTVTIRNAVADTKNRIVATVDSEGNRTDINYDLAN